MTEAARIAVTVIGGYLGAGKTTLLNHILRGVDELGVAEPGADERIAVIVNDFGSVNVDLDLIERRTDDTIELSNGCICCSMVDGFSATLDRVVALDPRPDRLVIEASGVADPATVAAYGHGPGLRLDAVVVLVDAETVGGSIEDRYVGQMVRQQLAAADLLVINKVDLIAAERLAEVTAAVEPYADGAFVLTATEARVPRAVLFDNAVVAHGALPVDADGTARPDLEPPIAASDLFSTTSIEPDAPVSRSWIDSLMADMDVHVVRAKGLVQLDDQPEVPHVLQRVGRRWTLRRFADTWPPGVSPGTRLVTISAIAD